MACNSGSGRERHEGGRVEECYSYKRSFGLNKEGGEGEGVLAGRSTRARERDTED